MTTISWYTDVISHMGVSYDGNDQKYFLRVDLYETLIEKFPC